MSPRASIEVRPSHSNPYSVTVTRGWNFQDRLLEMKPTRTFVISQAGLEKFVLDDFLRSLPAKPDEVILLKQGEEEKHIRNLQPVYEKLLDGGVDRKSVILALGGGVVGDFAGYVAATILRGVRFLQFPTTLLAAVDSSVGGKVAVNLDRGKNMVGAFYHPAFVYFNVDTLRTLPETEWVCGLAEMAKHAMLSSDKSIFDFLEKHAGHMRDPASDDLVQAVMQSIGVKASVVGQDEKEEGLRAVLNLGHTTAHSIESVTGYSTFSHGAAVSRGLVTMLFLSQAVLGLGDDDAARMLGLLERLRLPMGTAGLNADDLLAHMKYDKKTEAGVPRFVLLKGIGSPEFGCRVEPDAFRRAWQTQESRYGRT